MTPNQNNKEQSSSVQGPFVVIPSWLWEDSAVSWKAKRLYGRIVSLSKKEGYCWAGNKYLAEDLKCSVSTIKRYLRILKKTGEIDYNEKADPSKQRIIWIRKKHPEFPDEEEREEKGVKSDPLRGSKPSTTWSPKGVSLEPNRDPQVRVKKESITQSSDCENDSSLPEEKETWKEEKKEESVSGVVRKDKRLEDNETGSPISFDGPNPEVKQLIDYFFNKCVESWHFKPEISGAIAGAKIKAKLKTYTIQDIKKEFRWYLTDFLRREGRDKFGFGIQTALSDYVFNLWLKEKSQWD